MKKNILLFVMMCLVVGFVVIHGNEASAAGYNINIPTTPIPGQNPVTISTIGMILQVVANFLIIVGPVILVTTLVASAIVYMTAGSSSTRVALAKKLFWYSILGGLIIFGVGVIINTIAIIVTRQFFCPNLMINVGPFGSVCF